MRLVWNMAGPPKKKKYILLLYGLYCIVYYIVLYITIFDAVDYYDVPGEVLDDWLKPTSVMFYLVWLAVGIPAIPAALGFNNIKSFGSGDVKKRSIFLLITVAGLGSGIILDTVILMGEWAQYIIFLPRICILIGASCAVYGLRPTE